MSGSYECPFCRSTDLLYYQLVIDQKRYDERGLRYWQTYRDEPFPYQVVLRCKNCQRPFISEDISAYTLPERAEPGPGWIGDTRDRDHLYNMIRFRQKPGHCVFCGKDLANIKYKPTRYCSSECRGNVNRLSWGNITWRKRREAKHCCEECGKGAWVVHHVIPVALWGTSEDSNLILLCEDCHKARHRILQPYLDKKQRELRYLFRKEKAKDPKQSTISDFL